MDFLAKHSLLRRQLKKVFGDAEIPSELVPFLETVDEAYRQFDDDRLMLERSLDLSSEELFGANAELRGTKVTLEQNVAERTVELRDANEALLEEIAERRAAEERRRRLEAKLLQTQKLESLGVLAGGIAHDFNNLLMAILGNAALALEEMPEDSPALRRLKEIESATTRAADLTTQMLAYSGKGKFKIELVEISTITEEMASLLEVSMSKKADLVFEMADDLPAIEADATQIGQVVMNLITNASDALEDEGGTVKLRTGVMDVEAHYLAECFLGDEIEPDRYAFLEVTDDGCGMEQATIEKIFDPFFTTKFTGRGLGLASVLGIVRAHGGAIRVSSAPNMGTRFTVLLPLSSNPARQAAAAPVSDDYDGTDEDLGIVLLIDDDEAIQRVLKGSLERAGFDVILTGDGAAGVRVFEAHHGEIVCVVLDLVMPVMDGPEAYKEIRKISEDVPVVLISGYEPGKVAESLGPSAKLDFVQKPFLPRELVAKIRGLGIGQD